MDDARLRALSLLRKADDDLLAAAHLANSPGVSVWIIGFHAQQAVEKALKAVLMGHGIRYPSSHDIAALVKMGCQAGLPPAPDADDLPYLTPFASLFRYEDENTGLPHPLDLKKLLAWARPFLKEDSSSEHPDDADKPVVD